MIPSARPARRHAGLTLISALVLSTLLSVGAAVSVAAQETPEPELTWAPLVTLPPIAAPTVVSPVELASGYTLGDLDAPVSIEVWEDFQCPYCRFFAEQVKPYLVENFVVPGDASLTFRHLAFLGEESHWAAVAADLAAEQDLFWPFHDYLFANQLGENVGSYELDRLLAIGEAAGLDMGTFRAGLVLDAARERFARIEADSRQDAGALGITGTPTLVLDGERLSFGSFEEAIAAIEAAVAAARGDDTGGDTSSPVPADPGPSPSPAG
jgi:protein-disulfide isomerase